MLVGEIGIPRRDYLYDMPFWEIKMTVRGYLRRLHPFWEMSRLTSYHARFAFGSENPPPTLSEWLPFPWERTSEAVNLPSDEEIKRLQQMMREENEKHKS